MRYVVNCVVRQYEVQALSESRASGFPELTYTTRGPELSISYRYHVLKARDIFRRAAR